MKKKMRWVYLILAIAMVLMAVVGCDTKDKEPEETQPMKTETKTEETKTEEPVEEVVYKITYSDWAEGPVSEDNYFVRTVNERFNIDLELLWFERDTYEQQLGVKLASGEIPDFWPRWKVNAITLYDQGILASFQIADIKENMPEFYETSMEWNETYDCQTWSQGMFDTTDLTKHYMLPNFQFNQISPMAMSIRKDWMENVGITKAPETLDEFGELLDKFTNGDPDGNGVDDTYGMTMRGKDSFNQLGMFVYHAYNISSPYNYVDVNGKPEYSYIQPGFKDAMKKMNEWYEAGYIDPEFITTGWKEILAATANNKLGIVDMSTWYRVTDPTSDTNRAIKEIPGASYIYAKPPAGPDGYYGYPLNGALQKSFLFGVQLEDDKGKFDKVMQLINGLVYNDEVHEVIYGEKGVHWDFTDFGIQYKPEFDTPDKRADIGSNATNTFKGLAKPAVRISYKYRNADFDEIKEKSMNNTNQYVIAARGTYGDELEAAYKSYDVDFKTVLPRWMIDFIVGAKSVDDDWDEYIADLEAIGMREGTKHIQRWAVDQASITEIADAQVDALN